MYQRKLLCRLQIIIFLGLYWIIKCASGLSYLHLFFMQCKFTCWRQRRQYYIKLLVFLCVFCTDVSILTDCWMCFICSAWGLVWWRVHLPQLFHHFSLIFNDSMLLVKLCCCYIYFCRYNFVYNALLFQSWHIQFRFSSFCKSCLWNLRKWHLFLCIVYKRLHVWNDLQMC